MHTAQRIIHTSTELFKKYGLRSVTMDDIAAELGISKKTIYTYYADKDTLVQAVMEAQIQHNQTCCDHDKANAKNALHETYLALAMIQKSMGEMNPSLVNDLKKYYPKPYQLLEQFRYNYLHKIIKDNIVRGIAEGLYRPDVDVNIITNLRLESMMLVFEPNFYDSTKHNLYYAEKQLLEHFLYGIATPKGQKIIAKYQQQL